MTDVPPKIDPTVIFLHLPKTAGVTLYQIIDRQYAPQHIYNIGGNFHTFEAFVSLGEADRARIRMLRGHQDFGLHCYLPQPATYLTLLREPVSRVISYFYFTRSRPQDHYGQVMASTQIDLKTYIESGIDISVDNLQTRMLCGIGDRLPFAACTTEHLQTAKKHLREHFAVVGLTERFDETLLLLKKALGWKNLFYIPRNVSAERPRKSQLPPATIAAIVQANQLDGQLYEYATALFEEQVRQQGPTFAREVARWQLVNRWLRPFLHAYWRLQSYSLRTWIRNLQTSTFTGEGK